MKTMTRPIFGRRSLRGISLVELLMAMGIFVFIIAMGVMEPLFNLIRGLT